MTILAFFYGFRNGETKIESERSASMLAVRHRGIFFTCDGGRTIDFVEGRFEYVTDLRTAVSMRMIDFTNASAGTFVTYSGRMTLTLQNGRVLRSSELVVDAIAASYSIDPSQPNATLLHVRVDGKRAPVDNVAAAAATHIACRTGLNSPVVCADSSGSGSAPAAAMPSRPGSCEMRVYPGRPAAVVEPPLCAGGFEARRPSSGGCGQLTKALCEAHEGVPAAVLSHWSVELRQAGGSRQVVGDVLVPRIDESLLCYQRIADLLLQCVDGLNMFVQAIEYLGDSGEFLPLAPRTVHLVADRLRVLVVPKDGSTNRIVPPVGGVMQQQQPARLWGGPRVTNPAAPAATRPSCARPASASRPGRTLFSESGGESDTSFRAAASSTGRSSTRPQSATERPPSMLQPEQAATTSSYSDHHRCQPSVAPRRPVSMDADTEAQNRWLSFKQQRLRHIGLQHAAERGLAWGINPIVSANTSADSGEEDVNAKALHRKKEAAPQEKEEPRPSHSPPRRLEPHDLRTEKLCPENRRDEPQARLSEQCVSRYQQPEQHATAAEHCKSTVQSKPQRHESPVESKPQRHESRTVSDPPLGVECAAPQPQEMLLPIAVGSEVLLVAAPSGPQLGLPREMALPEAIVDDERVHSSFGNGDVVSPLSVNRSLLVSNAVPTVAAGYDGETLAQGFSGPSEDSSVPILDVGLIVPNLQRQVPTPEPTDNEDVAKNGAQPPPRPAPSASSEASSAVDALFPAEQPITVKAQPHPADFQQLSAVECEQGSLPAAVEASPSPVRVRKAGDAGSSLVRRDCSPRGGSAGATAAASLAASGLVEDVLHEACLASSSTVFAEDVIAQAVSVKRTAPVKTKQEAAHEVENDEEEKSEADRQEGLDNEEKGLETRDEDEAVSPDDTPTVDIEDSSATTFTASDGNAGPEGDTGTDASVTDEQRAVRSTADGTQDEEDEGEPEAEAGKDVTEGEEEVEEEKEEEEEEGREGEEEEEEEVAPVLQAALEDLLRRRSLTEPPLTRQADSPRIPPAAPDDPDQSLRETEALRLKEERIRLLEAQGSPRASETAESDKSLAASPIAGDGAAADNNSVILSSPPARGEPVPPDSSAKSTGVQAPQIKEKNCQLSSSLSSPLTPRSAPKPAGPTTPPPQPKSGASSAATSGALGKSASSPVFATPAARKPVVGSTPMTAGDVSVSPLTQRSSSLVMSPSTHLRVKEERLRQLEAQLRLQEYSPALDELSTTSSTTSTAGSSSRSTADSGSTSEELALRSMISSLVSSAMTNVYRTL
jgi:hypothetical protein